MTPFGLSDNPVKYYVFQGQPHRRLGVHKRQLGHIQAFGTAMTVKVEVRGQQNGRRWETPRAPFDAFGNAMSLVTRSRRLPDESVVMR